MGWWRSLMRGRLSQGPSRLVGLDIGSSLLKIVQVHRRRRSFRVERWAVLPVEPGMIQDGRILDLGKAAALVRQAVKEARITVQKAVICTGGPSVVTRSIILPPLAGDDLAAAVAFEAPQQLPIPEDQLIYDFTPVPESATAPDQLPVFLAGTHRPLVDGMRQVLDRAGLRPMAIELDCMAQWRALERLGLGVDAAVPHVVIDVGESRTHIAILRHGVPMLARTISTGVGQLRTALEQERSLTPDAADMLLREDGIGADGSRGGACETWVGDLLGGLDQSIQFCLIQHRGLSLERFYLVGGGARIPHLGATLRSYLTQLSTERPDTSLLTIPGIDPPLSARVHLPEPGPLLLGAVGAALWEA